MNKPKHDCEHCSGTGKQYIYDIEFDCICTEKLFAEEDTHDEFIERYN